MRKKREESKTHHDINDEDSDVTERRSTSSEIRERLVTRGIDDEETGEFVFSEITLHIEDCEY